MPPAQSVTLPDPLRRVVLINPGKFLGNLLLAGGLMQRYALWCQEQGVTLTLVLDARYRELARHCWPGVQVIDYPRHALEQGSRWQALRRWWECVDQIRQCRADLAVSLEEDAVAHALTRLSAARLRVGSSPERNSLGLHVMLPVNRSQGVAEGRHIWFSYHAVLRAVGMPAQGKPHYLRLPPLPLSAAMRQRLVSLGADLSRPLALLHAGATKPYKQWPLQHFATLARKLDARGMQVLLLGVGAADRNANRWIQGQGAGIDLCDELSLTALIGLLREANLMVGNDSGPAHLAAALKVPSVVIFGPTEQAIWQPLGEHRVPLSARHLCDPDCRRRHCLRELACLQGITPERVLKCLEQRRLLSSAVRTN